MQEHAADQLDRHRQTIALLTDYLAGGRVIAHVEYLCGGYLDCAAAFRHRHPHGSLPF